MLKTILVLGLPKKFNVLKNDHLIENVPIATNPVTIGRLAPPLNPTPKTIAG
jgi:hypothetical protein